MGRIAVVFPGQGSQYVGMARKAFEESPEFAGFIREAGEAAGMDLRTLALDGPEETIRQTRYQQPLLVAISIGLFKLLQGRGFTPHAVAGHSLGEYAALAAAGALDPLDAVRIVRERGRLMEEAVSEIRGTMAAILGLSREATESACSDASPVGIVQIANLNCPGQIVISGEIPAVGRAMEIAKTLGAKRCIQLPVSGPFHSAMMAPVKDKLRELLEGYAVREPQIPIIMNYTGDYATEPQAIKDLMAEQAAGSVRWEGTISRFLMDGVDHFVEVGPGKVLSGLIKKCAGSRAFTLNVEDIGDLDGVDSVRV